MSIISAFGIPLESGFSHPSLTCHCFGWRILHWCCLIFLLLPNLMIRILHWSITMSPISKCHVWFIHGCISYTNVIPCYTVPCLETHVCSGHYRTPARRIHRWHQAGCCNEARGYVSIVQLLLDALADPWLLDGLLPRSHHQPGEICDLANAVVTSVSDIVIWPWKLGIWTSIAGMWL